MKLLFFFSVFILNFNVFYSQISKIKSDKIYTLTAIFIEKQKNTLASNKATFNFNTKYKTAECATDCRLIGLKYKTKKNKLKFSKIIPIGLTCPDHLLGLEEDLKQNLPKVTTFKIINKQLVFFNNTDTLLIFNE
jgi:heat shock protein HslJ